MATGTGVKGPGSHSLRHSCARHWLQSGLNVSLFRVAGHSSPTVTLNTYLSWPRTRWETSARFRDSLCAGYSGHQQVLVVDPGSGPGLGAGLYRRPGRCSPGMENLSVQQGPVTLGRLCRKAKLRLSRSVQLRIAGIGLRFCRL